MTLLYVRLFYCREVIYMPLIISYHVIFDTFNTYAPRRYDVFLGSAIDYLISPSFQSLYT
ncbi:hypothetical protein [Wolbachia endosymbiont (group A) of Tiphia femorata]|uniref:hypothetical protein n=1 Tax=Wolbachia endosymbiont (group A) of Tiphia femorata TaxID=2954063 RepID=UPI00222EDE24|nr:hypothetical protein [Wolbachia endosymbiont (group A) of Tiphia femorata]